jgi:hypothetical protein
VQYVPASERRAVFEEFCKESAVKPAGRGKAAAGGGAKPSGGKASAGAAARAGGGAAAARAAAAGGAAAQDGEGAEEGGHHQSAQAAFEALLDEIEQACSPAEGAGVGAPTAEGGRRDGSNGAVEGEGGGGGGSKPGGSGGGGGAGPLLRWDERLTLDQLESFWGSDPRWRRCGAEARQQLFDARIARMRDAARKELEEGFRWVQLGARRGGGSRGALRLEACNASLAEGLLFCGVEIVEHMTALCMRQEGKYIWSWPFVEPLATHAMPRCMPSWLLVRFGICAKIPETSAAGISESARATQVGRHLRGSVFGGLAHPAAHAAAALTSSPCGSPADVL